MGILPWTAPDPLNSTAQTLSIYLYELQHNINHVQTDASLSQTTFPPITGKFMKNSVEEMKNALGNSALLGYYGYSSIKQILGHNWTAYPRDASDAIDCWGYQILQDLRDVIDALQKPGIYILRWKMVEARTFPAFEIKYNFTISSNEYNDLTLDTSYFYTNYIKSVVPVDYRIYKYDKFNGLFIGQSSYIFPSLTKITCDGEHIFGMSVAIFPSGFGIRKFRVSDFQLLASGGQYGNENYQLRWPQNITIDQNYLYVIDRGGTPDNVPKIKVFGKTNLNFIKSKNFNNIYINLENVSIESDSEYLYIHSNISPRLRKYDKATLSLISSNNAIEIIPTGSFIMVDNTYVYLFGNIPSYTVINRYNKNTLIFIDRIVNISDFGSAATVLDNWYSIATGT